MNTLRVLLDRGESVPKKGTVLPTILLSIVSISFWAPNIADFHCMQHGVTLLSIIRAPRTCRIVY